MKEWLVKQLKTIKKWRRRYKGMKVMQKIFKVLIAIINIGISAWRFYENVLKEQLDKRSDKKTTS